MEIKEIIEPRQKKAIAREILEALPEWFGIPQAREQYIAQSAGQPFFAALQEERPIGFCCLMPTGRDTVELVVMGVRREHHRQGVGRALVEAAREHAAAAGYSFLQVKTVQMGRYREFDETNRFYLSLGFREFEVFPKLWDEWNPCQIYVMAIQ